MCFTVQKQQQCFPVVLVYPAGLFLVLLTINLLGSNALRLGFIDTPLGQFIGQLAGLLFFGNATRRTNPMAGSVYQFFSRAPFTEEKKATAMEPGTG